MANFLNQLLNPQINHTAFFEVMRDFRKGGLKPDIFDQFMADVGSLPKNGELQETHFQIFDKYNLTDVTQEDFDSILGQVIALGIEKSKKCWHPDASAATCNLDSTGKIKVSAAHSIQNNGVLSQIVEDGHVMTYKFKLGELDSEKKGKNHASIFWGFCNTHDAIFKPIELHPYHQTTEQNFLFAYRGFVVSSHKKLEVSQWMNFGEESVNDIEENKTIFDRIIVDGSYSLMKTEVFELDSFYPIAVSSAFYLDFDFEGNSIPHSDNRMEMIFITLLPNTSKTYFLISYFDCDTPLYGNLGQQLRSRNNLKSDITMLIAAHVENVYFNPVYYETFIEQYEKHIMVLLEESQFDIGRFDNDGVLLSNFSFTPPDYLKNEFGINFFGY
ncbi:MAG: hypothetical protein QE487_17210 [Fluviicola sp.]|nr:hypothetical protein [Fluviicola sp.]